MSEEYQVHEILGGTAGHAAGSAQEVTKEANRGEEGQMTEDASTFTPKKTPPSVRTPASPTSSSSPTPRKGSLAPVTTDRALKDPINITIFELKRDNPNWIWQKIADEVNRKHTPNRSILANSCSQRYDRTAAAFSALSPEELEAKRRDSQKVTPKTSPNKVETQKQLAELVQKAIAMVDDRDNHWASVAEFVNMRLLTVSEHLTPADAERIAEQSPKARYDMLIAAAVAACDDKYWRDVANLVNFQLETVRDGKLSAEDVKKIASKKREA